MGSTTGWLAGWKNTAGEGRGGQVDLSANGQEDEGSGAGGGGDVRPPPPEYRCLVNRH